MKNFFMPEERLKVNIKLIIPPVTDKKSVAGGKIFI